MSSGKHLLFIFLFFFIILLNYLFWSIYRFLLFKYYLVNFECMIINSCLDLSYLLGNSVSKVNVKEFIAVHHHVLYSVLALLANENR